MEELKPCPFCGGEAEIKSGSIVCKSCGAKVRCGDYDIRKPWNQRAERTCKVTPSKSLQGIVVDEEGNAFPDYYEFCPYCGARVVGDWHE